MLKLFPRLLAVALFAVPLLLTTAQAAAPVNAQTGGPCQAQFTALRTDTQTVAITSGQVDRERAGLLKLIEDAQSLASIGKTGDAITKLNNFIVKVNQLQSAGRISAESANRLRSDAAATIACLQGSAG